MTRSRTGPGRPGCSCVDPLAQLPDGDLGRLRPTLRSISCGQSCLQHERRLVHDAELERVGDLLEDGDVGPGGTS